MEFGTKEYYYLELLGLQILQQSGFVLVAGGLGERLGYNGIKVSLPVETLTMTSYLEFYIRKILSYQVHFPDLSLFSTASLTISPIAFPSRS